MTQARVDDINACRELALVCAPLIPLTDFVCSVMLRRTTLIASCFWGGAKGVCRKQAAKYQATWAWGESCLMPQP